MMQEQTMPHSLTLTERSRLTMTGATEVLGFDENFVALKTELGVLTVQGTQLQLKELSPAGGNVAVEGRISALSYAQPRSGGWLSRLLG